MVCNPELYECPLLFVPSGTNISNTQGDIHFIHKGGMVFCIKGGYFTKILCWMGWWLYYNDVDVEEEMGYE